MCVFSPPVTKRPVSRPERNAFGPLGIAYPGGGFPASLMVTRGMFRTSMPQPSRAASVVQGVARTSRPVSPTAAPLGEVERCLTAVSIGHAVTEPRGAV